ncbi:beta-galactosidase [Marinomonas fungiae]|uniref:Beta-galactosidase n=1 Tax=Marinomonas fungiae TaxID=1137284 RepID=A0A0K6II36_9GAMM|nr:beta-galactosidase [Marinomonas fungiae]CUB02770.1 Beta-galactosidase [Marinomonas fungiae]
MLGRVIATALLVGSAVAPVFAASSSTTTLIAPMLEGNGLCLSGVNNPDLHDLESMRRYCEDLGESSASLLETILSDIGPKNSADGRFEMGYMLGLSLLSYVELKDGEFSVNRNAIRNSLQLLQDSERSAVLYFFANHFIGADAAELAKTLSESDNELMVLNNGTTPRDGYFSSTIYPWRVGDTGTQFYKVRKLALEAVLDELCALPKADLAKIKAVTTLGEVHHQFPNFNQGMGYDDNYEITDYSVTTIEQFKAWLASEFGTIERLNTRLGAHFSSFSDISPPAKDIRKDKLNSFFEHIDPYAHGVMPFFGWAFSKDGSPFEINVYLDGQYLDQAQTGLTRVDVAQALPELSDSNVGYRYNLDFSHLSPGRHSVELRFFHNGEESILSQYDFAVIDRSQSRPRKIQGFHLASVDSNQDSNIRFWADHPTSTVGVFYNPLAKLWLNFREQQVTREIEQFADIIQHSCISPEQVFSHQIAPNFNPSWDPTLFAANDSLEINAHYNLGINLYGGIISSDIFFDWLKQHHHSRYALPEMHPMLPQDPIEFSKVLERHHDNGAVFLSPYFMSLVPDEYASDPEHGRFKLSPSNTEYGSDTFFRSIQRLLNKP